MLAEAIARTRFIPDSPEERELVRAELAELLRTPQFSNSRRYPALLSYVVEQTLAGQADDLKERILGIEVFHRATDYDTNNDTVVRVAAGEVRKRLALIYHEVPDRTVRITLPSGSYVPEFTRSTPIAAVEPDPAPLDSPAIPPTPTPASRAEPVSPRRTWTILATSAALFLVAALLWLHFVGLPRRDSLTTFWEPFESAGTSVLLAPGTVVSSASSPYGMAPASRNSEYSFTSMATTVAMANLVSLFSRTHAPYLVQPTSTTTLDDLRHHPSVLLGAYNNEWTPRLQGELRYRFVPGPSREIVDSTNSATFWMRPAQFPITEEDDYAVIARFHSKLTDNFVVLLAGIGKNGTEAAADFVTDPRYLDLLKEHDRDWASKNLEIVLKVHVVNGKNGAPSIQAVEVW